MANIKMTGTLIESIMSNTLQAGGTVYLQIYKGTPPVDFSTEYVNINSRATDRLINFTTDKISTFDLNKTRIIQPSHVEADLTGTATWFVYNGGNFPVLGTVGLPGSNNDLIIGDINITAGESYNVANFYISIPTNYTY